MVSEVINKIQNILFGISLINYRWLLLNHCSCCVNTKNGLVLELLSQADEIYNTLTTYRSRLHMRNDTRLRSGEAYYTNAPKNTNNRLSVASMYNKAMMIPNFCRFYVV